MEIRPLQAHSASTLSPEPSVTPEAFRIKSWHSRPPTPRDFPSYLAVKTMLSMQESRVRSLIRELDSHMLKLKISQAVT